MNFDFYTEVLPESFRWDPANPVAGTTKFYVRTAEALAQRGHNVTVRYDGGRCILNGVLYCGRDEAYLGGETVLLDANAIRPNPPMGCKRLHWSSLYRHNDYLDANYDHIFLNSSFHISTTIRGSRIPKSISALPLACDLPVVPFGDEGLEKREKVCCYTSSPDRGLGFLKGIWSDVKRETGYELVHTDYSTSDVGEILRGSRFWLHPATGVELYCVSAVEAQASGCIPFYVPHMALPETIRYGIQTDLFKFKDDLIKTLNGDKPWHVYERQRQFALTGRPLPTWDDVAASIEKVL